MSTFKSKFISILWSLILIIIFLRPFLSAYAYPHLEKYYRSVLLILFFLWVILNRKFVIPKFSLLNYSFLLFIIAMIVSTIFSINRQASYEQILNFLPCFAIFYLMYQTEERQKEQIITTMIISASIIGIYTIYQFLFGLRHTLEYLQKTVPYPYAKEFLSRKRAFATFFSPDMLAGYLAMMIPLTLGLILKKLFFNADSRKSNPSTSLRISGERSRTTNADKRRCHCEEARSAYEAISKGKRLLRFARNYVCDHLRAICENLRSRKVFQCYYLVWILPVILLIALLLTKSLGGIISLAAALFVFIYLLKPKNRKLTFLSTAFILLLILPMVLLRAPSFLDFSNPQNTIIQRLRYWTAALKIIKDHPFLGVGLGNFANIYLKYKLPQATEIRFVHNSYLQIWAETGVLGIIGLLGMIFSFLRKGLISQKNPFQVGLLSAGIAFLFHNLLDFSFFIPEVALNCWVILGLVMAKDIKRS